MTYLARHPQVPTYAHPHTLTEARSHARRVANFYGGVLDRADDGALFNTTDIRVLTAAIFDLLGPWRGQRDD